MGNKLQITQVRQCTRYFCTCSILGLLAQNPRCLYVQTEFLWMVVLVFPSYLPSWPSPHHLPNCITPVLTSCHPKSEFTSKCCCETNEVRSMICDNNASQVHVSQVTVLHLHACYAELLPSHSPSSKRCLGRTVIAVKLL